MKTKKILQIFAVAILASVGLIVARWGVLSLVRDRPVCLFCNRSHLIHNYYHATGISEKCASDSPDDTIKVYGTPERVESEVLEGSMFTQVRYHYNGFSINFLTEDGVNYKHDGFTLYSPKIKIRYDIHVGSTREQIINAYAECQKYTDIELGCFYLDTGHKNAVANCVDFEYDENDIVTKIVFYSRPL